MKQEQVSDIIGNIDDRHIAEAVQYDPARGRRSPERTVHMKKKRIITFALAAALILALGATAYAAYGAVATPQAAERVAREQIEVWKNMGLLNQSLVLDGPATKVLEIQAETGSDYYYGRLFPHRYDVRWYPSGSKYHYNLSVDTLTGKIVAADIDAVADEDAVPVREESVQIPDDALDPDTTYTAETFRFYDNFTDIFPADITVDRFCSLLAEYWGFSGYRLAETNDSFYRSHFEPIDGSTLLKDLDSDSRSNYYLTVFFDGDQEGAPRYIQLQQFPGYVTLTLGLHHSVG